MLLQTVTLPREDICPCEEMYFRRSYGSARLFDDRIVLQLGDKIAFDTYFGCFCSSRWLQYTNVNSFYIGIRAHGKARCTVLRRWMNGDEYMDELVFEDTIEFPDGKTWYSESFPLVDNSVYSFELSCSNGIFSFFGGAYCTEAQPTQEVNIALDICTYKREAAVKSTMNMLSSEIFRSKSSRLRGHLGVIVSDNGGTLGDHSTKDGSVRIVSNRNLGGVGGFTRGMLEAVTSGKYTHVLLADDDATLNPVALERTLIFLSMLRPEHSGITLGGALLRSDIPWLQYEAGARWKGGPMEIVGHSLDLRRVADVIKNGINCETVDYAGWWYCCIPVSKIRKNGLPMPLFIHRDDVEYGLRCGEITTLPGICVWHEAFELKMPGTSEYYDLRNTAIVNALHCPEYNAASLSRFLGKWVAQNIMMCRYKYVDMNLEGIRDFLKGPDYLLKTDGAEIHRRISQMDYRMSDITELEGFDGIQNFEEQFAEQLEAASAGTVNFFEGLKDKSLNVMSVVGLGGGVLPARKDTVLALQPCPVRRCFRAGRIIHCSSDRRGYEVQRDNDEIKRCLNEYREICAQLKENYAAVAQQYRDSANSFRSASYWRKILGL